MSNGTNVASAAGTFILSEVQIQSIQHGQAMIANYMACLGVLVTLSIVLILLSTRRQRRSFLLALQVFAFTIVIALLILLTVYMFRTNGNTFANYPDDDPKVLELNRMGVAIDSLGSWAPWVADSVLIYRVDNIYSRRFQMNRIRRYLPVFPLIVLLVARAALLSVCIYVDWQASQSNWSNNVQLQDWLRLRLAEWILQIVYCSYAFVMIIRQIMRMTRGSSLLKRKIPNSQTRNRLRFLVEVVLMTFFIPLITQIGTLIAMIIIYIDPSNDEAFVTWSRFLQANYLLSVVFCILATSWSTIRENASSISPRRSKASSDGSPVGFVKSRGSDSTDEDIGQLEVHPNAKEGQQPRFIRSSLPSAPQQTLLDVLFCNNNVIDGLEDDEEEEIEELRTTQFISSQQVDYRPPLQRFTSQSAMLPGSNRSARSVSSLRLPITHLLSSASSSK